MNVQLEGTEAADIFGKGKQKVWIIAINLMVQFEINGVYKYIEDTVGQEKKRWNMLKIN